MKKLSDVESQLDRVTQDKSNVDSKLLRCEHELTSLTQFTTKAQEEITRLKLQVSELEHNRDVENAACNRLIEHLKLTEREAQEQGKTLGLSLGP